MSNIVLIFSYNISESAKLYEKYSYLLKIYLITKKSMTLCMEFAWLIDMIFISLANQKNFERSDII